MSKMPPTTGRKFDTIYLKGVEYPISIDDPLIKALEESKDTGKDLILIREYAKREKIKLHDVYHVNRVYHADTLIGYKLSTYDYKPKVYQSYVIE